LKKRIIEPYPLIAPLPPIIASVACESSGDNLITLAWAGVVASEPPHVGIGVRRDSRFSHHILLENGEFGINIAGESMISAVDICGTRHGDQMDKWEAASLSRMKASIISVPLIEEFPINLECIVRNVVEVGSHDYFIGEVVATHIDESLLVDNRLDCELFKPLAYIPGSGCYRGLRSGDLK